MRFTRWLPGAPPEGVLILGTSSLARKIASAIESSDLRQGLLLGMLDDRSRTSGEASRYPIVGHMEELQQVLTELRPDRIIIALTERRGQLPVNDLLKCRLRGIVVENGVRAYERLHGKLSIESLRPSYLVFQESLKVSRPRAALKRFTSVTVAAAGLLLSAPVMALVALLIRLDSDGPILFGQDRVGRNGRRFKLVKFRSMRVDGHTGSEWAADNADRVTRVGYWLRRFHLDELPQFLNILNGDMDLVGPRPHPVTNYALFDREIPYYCLRSLVRPGLTGWAQIRLGYANGLAEETEKMRYDLYYIKNQSLWLDVKVILWTLVLMVLGRDYPEPIATSSAIEDSVPAPASPAQADLPSLPVAPSSTGAIYAG